MTHPRSLARGLLFALTALAATGAAEEPKGPASLGSLVNQIAALFPPLSGAVVEVRDEDVILSLGRREGAQVGMEFSLVREGRELRHPTTGDVLGRVEQELGLAVVAQVSETYSVATVARDGGVRPGDRARISASPISLTVAALGSEGVSPGLLETVYNELADELTGTRRFRVINGAAFGAAAAQARIPHERVIQGEGLAETASRYRVGHLLVLWVKQVGATPYIEARLFSFLPGREIASVLSAGLFVPSALTAPAATPSGEPAASSHRQFSASREPQDTSRPSRSFLTRLFFGEGDSGAVSAGSVSARVKEVRRFGFPVVAMDVAVSPQDKVPRLVITDGQTIYLYRITGRALESEWTYAAGGSGKVFSVQLADLDHDGVLEIVVNRYSPQRNVGITSFILTTREGKATVVVRDFPQILVAVDATGDGVKRALWSQRFTPEGFFAKGQAERQGLRDGTLAADGSVRVPPDFRAMGVTLANIAGPDPRALAYVDDLNRLAIATEGKEQWRSPTRARGGDFLHLEVVRQSDRTGRSAFYAVEPSPVAVDLDGDGVDEVVVPQNQPEGTLMVVYRSPVGYRFKTIFTGFEGVITGLGAVRGSAAPTLILSAVQFEGIAKIYGETSILVTTLE